MNERQESGRPTLNRYGKKAPPGPWWDEPDRIEWRHAGLECLALRGPFGSWNGYVAVPVSHVLHGRDYSDQLTAGLRVHGGLTYAGGLTTSGGDGKAWWFGFDCAHAGDYSPGLEPMTAGWAGAAGGVYVYQDVYRDRQYVQGQVEALASQLAGWVGDVRDGLHPLTVDQVRRLYDALHLMRTAAAHEYLETEHPKAEEFHRGQRDAYDAVLTELDVFMDEETE